MTVGARLWRAVVAFGRFWWDFLIGDTPEVTVGVIVVVVAALLLRHQRIAAIVLLPVLVGSLLIATTWRGRRAR